MTHLKINIPTKIICFLFLAALPISLFSTTYTAVLSGNWDSSLTWGGNMPGNTISSDDQIVINAGVTVNMNVDVEINHQLAVMTLLGNLENASHNLTVTAGTVAGTGEIVVQELIIGASGTVATTNNIICDVFESSSTSLTLQSSLHVSQMLTLSGGDLEMSNTGSIMLNSNATIQMAGGNLLLESGHLDLMGTYNLLYTGSADSTGQEISIGTIGSLTLQLSSPDSTLVLTSDLSITDTTNLMVGELVLNGNSLSLQGAVLNESNASINGDLNATIDISGNADAEIIFSENGGELDTLIINQNGASFTLGSDLIVHELLQIEQGECILNGQSLNVNALLETQAGATITTDSDATLQLDGMGDVTVFLTHDDNVLSQLVISQMNGNASFNSNIEIANSLTLMQGHLILADNDLTLGANAQIIGANDNHHIQTNGSGTLNIFLEAGDTGTLFPVGSEDGYFPCIIAQNEGSSDTQIEVSVMEGVFAEGEAGADLTASESLVNHTWLVSQTDANASVDLDFEFFWDSSSTVNGFDPDHCFISHYTNNTWDTYAAASASVDANGSFSISRENITSLSPFRVADQMVLAIGQPSGKYRDYELYPNPANGHIFIDLPKEIKASSLKIYDQTGSLVMQHNIKQTTSTQSIALDDLKPGMYLVKMEGAMAKWFVKK